MLVYQGRNYEPQEFVDEIVRIAGDVHRSQHERDYAIEALVLRIAQGGVAEASSWLEYCRVDCESQFERLIHHWIVVATTFSYGVHEEMASEGAISNAIESLVWLIEFDPSTSLLGMPWAYNFEGAGATRISQAWGKVLLDRQTHIVRSLENALEFFHGREGQQRIYDEIQHQINSGQKLTEIFEELSASCQ